MKTNSIKGSLNLYQRIEELEKENKQLKEYAEDCTEFIRILEEWLKDDEEEFENNTIDMGTY